MSSIHRPKWFSDETIMVSTAPTCGLTKGGRTRPLINPATGARIKVRDPETGEFIDAVDDQLLQDVEALRSGRTTETLTFVEASKVSLRCAVPAYYDRRYEIEFLKALKKKEFKGFRAVRLGDLQRQGIIDLRSGHGSPTTDQRVGEVPYIKVSDLRAGLVNINPTNRVPTLIAEAHWKGSSSGLKCFDLLCPERTSKNIGDFCMLMPGQERVLLTKEIIVLRPGVNANFDPFYLIWAMTLKIVRKQWNRIVFMQTNREDVGDRYLEILIPIPESIDLAKKVSEPFRHYYTSLAECRTKMGNYLTKSKSHHFFVSGDEQNESEES